MKGCLVVGTDDFVHTVAQKMKACDMSVTKLQLSNQKEIEKPNFPIKRPNIVVFCLPSNMELNESHKKLKSKILTYLQEGGVTRVRVQSYQKQNLQPSNSNSVEPSPVRIQKKQNDHILYCLNKQKGGSERCKKFFDVPLQSIVFLEQLVEKVKCMTPSTSTNNPTPAEPSPKSLHPVSSTSSSSSSSSTGNILSSVASIISVAACVGLGMQNFQQTVQMNKDVQRMHKIESMIDVQMKETQILHKQLGQQSQPEKIEMQQMHSLCEQLSQKSHSMEQKLNEQIQQTLSLKANLSKRPHLDQLVLLEKKLTQQVQFMEKHIKSQSTQSWEKRNQRENQTQSLLQMSAKSDTLSKKVDVLEKKMKDKMQSIKGLLDRHMQTLDIHINQTKSLGKQIQSTKETFNRQFDSREQLMEKKLRHQEEQIRFQQQKLDEITENMARLSRSVDDLRSSQEEKAQILGKQLCEQTQLFEQKLIKLMEKRLNEQGHSLQIEKKLNQQVELLEKKLNQQERLIVQRLSQQTDLIKEKWDQQKESTQSFYNHLDKKIVLLEHDIRQKTHLMDNKLNQLTESVEKQLYQQGQQLNQLDQNNEHLYNRSLNQQAQQKKLMQQQLVEQTQTMEQQFDHHTQKTKNVELHLNQQVQKSKSLEKKLNNQFQSVEQKLDEQAFSVHQQLKQQAQQIKSLWEHQKKQVKDSTTTLLQPMSEIDTEQYDNRSQKSIQAKL